MITTLNPHIRILALIGLLAGAALVVSTQLVFRGVIFSSESQPAAVPASVSGAATKAETPTNAKAPKADATQSGAKADTNSSAATATKTATAGTTSTTTKRPLRTHGLPVPVARALQVHRVVVVSVYTPNAVVDRLARAEAEAGAREVGAGFVALNALERRTSEPLAAKVGVLETPSVLVYTRPAKLFVRLDGFADLATVAQAADNARR